MMKFKKMVSGIIKPDKSRDVRWKAPNGTIQGYGYLSDTDHLIHVIHCPSCGGENYMAQTVCVKCGFDANPEATKEEAHEDDHDSV